MSERQALTIIYAEEQATGLEDQFWLRLEQKIESDEASMSDTAALVDAVYDVAPCADPLADAAQSNSVWSQMGTTEQLVAASVITQEQALALQTKLQEEARKMPSMGACKQDSAGNWLAQLKVVRSHQDEPYTLSVTNGKVTGTVLTSEQIDTYLPITKASSVTLPYPVIVNNDIELENNVEFRWAGPVISAAGVHYGPEIFLSGTTLYWLGELSGSIHVIYPTKYDLADITVFGSARQLGECKALGFYHSMVDKCELEPPEQEGDDLDRAAWCPNFSDLGIGWGEQWEVVPNPPKPPWVTTRTTYRCECTGKISHVERSNEPTRADIDEGKYSFPGVYKDIEGGYIDCNEYTGRVSEHSYYEEICCHPPSQNVLPLPKCEKIYRANPGGFTPDDDELADLQEKYGKRLRIVPVSPEDGWCGTLTIKQSIDRKSCCDGVPALYDLKEDLTVGNNSSILITIGGGRGPYTWTTSTSGAHFAGGAKKTITNERDVLLFTDEVCGKIAVKVTDGCTVAPTFVKAEAGEWVLKESWDWDADFAAGIAPPCIEGEKEETGGSQHFSIMVTTNGEHKLVEEINTAYYFYLGGSVYWGGYEYHCAVMAAQAKEDTVFPCALPPIKEGSLFDKDCCDSNRCWPDEACKNDQCNMTYCFHCEDDYYAYAYQGGPWWGYTLQLLKARLYAWVCTA